MPKTRLFIAAAAAALLAPGVGAQSDNHLRQENQRLRTQVQDLQRELEATRDRIAELEREIEELRQQLRTGSPRPPTTGPTQPKVTIDESVPNASPRALMKALKESYLEATTGLELGATGAAGERQRNAYLREVRNWVRRVNRELKSPVAWHVRVVASQVPEASGTEFVAVDPKTEAVLGDPFPVILNTALRRRLRQLEQRGRPEVLLLRGVLVPQVRINPYREEPGPFNNPPLIGMFAEFGFVVEASSLTVPVPPEQEQPAKRS